MGKADLKVTVGLLVLGVAIGAILLRVMKPPGDQARQVAGQGQTMAPLRATPPTPVPRSSPGTITPPAQQPTLRQQATARLVDPSSSVPPSTVPPPPPKKPPGSSSTHRSTRTAMAAIVKVDIDRREILAEVLAPPVPPGGPPDRTAEALTGEPRGQKIIRISDATRIERMIVEQNQQGGSAKATVLPLQLGALRPQDVVFCTYRIETPEALEDVEAIVLTRQMGLGTYLMSDERKLVAVEGGESQ